MLVRGGGSTVLIDSGPGTMGQLLKVGVEIWEVDALLLSHFHPDHSSELPGFLFATKYPDLSRRKKRLQVAGGTGFKLFYDRLNRAFNDYLTFPEELFTLHELGSSGLTPLGLNGFDIEHATVNHKAESRAYKLTTPGGISLVYSGDTDVSDNLVTLSKNADLLIIESALPDGQKMDGHLTPSLAGAMAADAGVKSLVLTHFYPECDGVDMRAQCRATYSGPLLLAEDLMEINL